jgi:hypothetical protein
MFSDSFAGIAPGSVAGYLVAQAVGGGVGLVLVRYLYPSQIPSDIPAEAVAVR